MPKLIASPTVIPCVGSMIKVANEFVGLVNTGDTKLSITRLQSPPGWVGIGQYADYHEYRLVLADMLHVDCPDGESRHQTRRMGPLLHAPTYRRRLYHRLYPRLFALHCAPRRMSGGPRWEDARAVKPQSRPRSTGPRPPPPDGRCGPAARGSPVQARRRTGHFAVRRFLGFRAAVIAAAGNDVSPSGRSAGAEGAGETTVHSPSGCGCRARGRRASAAGWAVSRGSLPHGQGGREAPQL